MQIWDTNNNVLQTVYTSQPGDILLADWTQRSVNLSSFAGRTVRVAFVVNAGEYYLDVGLDDVSVKCSTLPPPTYSVYYGTNSVPGPGQLLGSTTNTVWNLPQPPVSFVTYYWQVVAARANQTAGPIWQFSTMPTFLISNVNVFIGNSGTTNAVFTVTLSDTNSPNASVYYNTADGTATNPVDYLSTSGYLSSPAASPTRPSLSKSTDTPTPLALRSFLAQLSFPSGAASPGPIRQQERFTIKTHRPRFKPSRSPEAR